jgi:glycerol uptake facilitator-like aquaporin
VYVSWRAECADQSGRGGTSVVQGLFIEMFLTAQLVFTIFMLAAEKHKGTFIAPVGELRLFPGILTPGFHSAR